MSGAVRASVRIRCSTSRDYRLACAREGSLRLVVITCRLVVKACTQHGSSCLMWIGYMLQYESGTMF
jgi:hypothetical protein